MEKALQSMEEEAERIYKEERPSIIDDEAASVRDLMYEQAEYIEREMEQMGEQIKRIIETVNANQGGDLDTSDGISPLDIVVRILNNQLNSLVWIDEKAGELSSRINKLADHGAALDRGPPRSRLWIGWSLRLIKNMHNNSSFATCDSELQMNYLQFGVCMLAIFGQFCISNLLSM